MEQETQEQCTRWWGTPGSLWAISSLCWLPTNGCGASGGFFLLISLFPTFSVSFLNRYLFFKVLYFLLLSINEWTNDRRAFLSEDASMYHPSWHVRLLIPSLFGLVALPKSSLLRILASLSLYLEIRRNSFSSDQHNPFPANCHQHRPLWYIYFIIPHIFFFSYTTYTSSW